MATSHYVGKAGQLAVMAELAWRGYNVSIPEIDVGDDIFALNDASGRLFRIQVKTATGRRLIRTATGRKLEDHERFYSCQFSVNRSHVRNQKSGTHYVLAARCGGAWRFLVFKKYVLARLIKKGLGTRMRKGRQMITVVFLARRKAASSTRRGATNLSAYAGRWEVWKRLPGGAPRLQTEQSQ
jgi:hypothetical protein